MRDFRLQFLEFGEEVCSKIKAQGYWADYIDPCSGLPMLTKSCNKVYSEVDGMECLLNYRAYNAGFCKVLTHPGGEVPCIRRPSFAMLPEPL